MNLIRCILFLGIVSRTYSNGQQISNGTHIERTMVLVKPDGVQRGLIGDVLKRFESKGLKLIAIKMLWPSPKLVELHCEPFKHKPFYQKTVNYLKSGPIVATVWEGYRVIQSALALRGGTNPVPGTIRFDYCTTKTNNVAHASEDVKEAEKDIALWFDRIELVQWEQSNARFIHGYDFR